MSPLESLHLAEPQTPESALMPEEALLLTNVHLSQRRSQSEPACVDLSGLTAKQAEWMLNATAGRERAAWREIARLLSAREAAQDSS